MRRRLLALSVLLASPAAPACRVAASTPLEGPSVGGPIVREEGTRVATPVVAMAVASGPACADDRAIRRCRVERPKVAPHALALAAGHGEVAVAWSSQGNSWLSDSAPSPAPGRVWVRRYDRALARFAETRVEFDGAVDEVALVATGTGWVLAAGVASRGIEVVTLSRAGAELGARGRVETGWKPRLAAGDGGPLLVFGSTEPEHPGAVHAARLGGDGAPLWRSRVFDSAIEVHFGGQVAVDGGAFLVARRTNEGVAVARVEGDGTVGERHVEFGGTTEYPLLAWCGDGARMAWSEFGQTIGVRWTRLDAGGRKRGEFSQLAVIPEAFNSTPLVCDGADTLALLGGHTGGTGVSSSLDLTRVDPSGVRRSTLSLRGDTRRGAFGHAMVRDGDALFAGWIVLGERPEIALARVDVASTRSALADSEAPPVQATPGASGRAGSPVVRDR